MTTSTRLDELKRWPNWIVRRADKIPLNPHTGQKASVIDPQTWSTFDIAAARCANDPTLGLGFVLTEADPFCFIDLDYSDDLAIVANQDEIYNGFNTYSERSPSGKGCHIIGKGSVPSGKKKDKVEVYSSKRYMTVTLEPIKDVPVAECQPQLDELFAAMNKGQTNNVPTQCESQPQTQSDDAVVAMAANAANGELFKQLLAGNWQGKYRSQSEADFAFIDIVAYYTDSMEQVARIFLASALGERIRTGAKPKSKTYISDMVNKSFDRKVSPAVDPNNFKVAASIENVPFPTNQPFKSKLTLIRGCDIVEAEQAWLIPDCIPENTLTGVLGVPGVGKTTFVNGILAHCSQMHNVLMLTNEDSPSDVRRNFKRLGGNLGNLFVEDSATNEMPWQLDNCEALENALKEYKPRIVGIDSFYSHAPSKADTNKHDSVAPSLVRLRQLANKYCPILLVHHDNKSSTTDPLKKSGGSQGIVGTIRHNVRVHEHPEDFDIRVVAVFKSNVGRMNVPSLQFRLDPFEWFLDRCDLSPAELLQPANIEADKARRTKAVEAKEFLTAEMANGNRFARELKERALLWRNISEATLDRARVSLGIESNKNADGVNVWSYPCRG